MVKRVSALYCHMNGERVGVLKRVSGTLTFQYDVGWIRSAHARPISVSMPLTDLPYKGDTVEAYFDNLLPDSKRVRRAIAERVNAKSESPYDLLASIGRDCVGALSITDSPSSPPVKLPQVKPLDAAALSAHIKRTRSGQTFGIQDDSEFRFSLAGAQDKTALTWHDGSLGIPVGSTPTTHILKPHIISNNPDIDLSTSVCNEWFCLELMRQLSKRSESIFEVAKAEILTIDNQYVLSVERFDRKLHDGFIYRLPQEDCCQALGVYSGAKYESDGGPSAIQIAELLDTSVDPYRNKLNFLRYQFIYFLLAAIDGHAKNFSVFILPGGKIDLTPIYDVMSAYPYFGQGDLQPKKIKMAMAVRSKNVHYKWSEILPRQWLPHAEKHGINAADIQPVFEEVLNLMPQALTAAKELAEQKYPFVLPVADNIEQHTLQLIDKYQRLGF